jgi:hypothetical protein
MIYNCILYYTEPVTLQCYAVWSNRRRTDIGARRYFGETFLIRPVSKQVHPRGTGATIIFPVL